MVSEARPVELWGFRADDEGEVTGSEKGSQGVGNMKKRTMLWVHCHAV